MAEAVQLATCSSVLLLLELASSHAGLLAQFAAHTALAEALSATPRSAVEEKSAAAEAPRPRW